MCPTNTAAVSSSHLGNGKRSSEDGADGSSKRPKQLVSLGNKIDRTNDDIHSSIDLCPVVKMILDSPPMQRLRKVKQLATAEHVYMNCTHTRFAHSLGVAHLAEKLCQRIAKRQPVLKATPKDILCVKLAGLMHDIGHGPFSHTYEDFIKTFLPEHLQNNPNLQEKYENLPPLDGKYKHEKVSLMLIDAVLESKGLRINLQEQKLDDPLETVITAATVTAVDPLSVRVFDSSSNPNEKDDNMILTSRDFVFIKECIWGGPIDHINAELNMEQDQFVGRTEPHQEWIYDIVSNRHSGCDVDKMDYYARDHRPAFKGSGEIEKLMIEEAVVAWGACTDPEACCDGKHLMICYPTKVVPTAMEFFRQRFRLHKNIYRHKKTDAVGYMVCDILKKADPFFRLTIPNKDASPSTGDDNYNELPISRASHNVHSFLRLTDSIIDMIANTRAEGLEDARKLIRRLEAGDHYKCVAVQPIDLRPTSVHRTILGLPSTRNSKNETRLVVERTKAIEHELVEGGKCHHKGEDEYIKLEEEDLFVEYCNIHCGRGPNNPLQRMRFLQKHQMKCLDSATKIFELPEAKEENEATYEAQMPRAFEENSIRVFCKDPSKCDLAKHVFDQWWLDQSDRVRQTTPFRPPKANFEGITPSPSMAKRDLKLKAMKL